MFPAVCRCRNFLEGFPEIEKGSYRKSVSDAHPSEADRIAGSPQGSTGL